MNGKIAQRVATLSISLIAPGDTAKQKALSRASRKIRQASISSFVVLIGFVGRVAAQTGESCGTVPDQFQAIATLLTRVQQLGIALALLIASVMLVYGGILWMRGTPEAQQKARRIIWNTLVGLTIVLMAGGLVEFMKGVLCGGSA